MKGYVESRIETPNKCDVSFGMRPVENETLARILKINNSSAISIAGSAVDSATIESLNTLPKAGDCYSTNYDDGCSFVSTCAGNDRDFCAITVQLV